MELAVCVPVLRRYDLLRQMLDSLVHSSIKPNIYIIDNGRQPDEIHNAIFGFNFIFEVYRPVVPMGVAESWNWFIERTDNERIITNDDIIFAKDSLKKITDVPTDIVFACGFSCFLIRDSCVEQVGYFDETISPGYAYFEDIDYMRRIERTPGVFAANAEDNGVIHIGSQTWQSGTGAQVADHWRKFDIAKANYIRKWGGLPNEETAKGIPS